ncbi:hypothetical protein [Streptomyces sp. NBC_01803]|uniref:hypothetical protein n=1 Tax=Streptomyces sp. NBC_01803 TaxID=2975946 RepID=UPI002DDA5677|nr:hypothetical protein [Streptomyces sp. NBC_01803]WSA43029.1 hypothetical protein OIE51_01755 [Streptomyces sp. NBC_01803]
MTLRRSAASAALTLAMASAAVLIASPAHATDIQPGTGAQECADLTRDEALTVELIGVPDPMVAGEWAESTYRVTNTYDHPVDTLYTFVEVGAYDSSSGADIASENQWYVDGAWVPIEPGQVDTGVYFGETGPLLPGEHAEARIRTRLQADPPEGTIGSAAFSATWPAGYGVCYSSASDLEFGVTTAEPAPGNEPEPATGGATTPGDGEPTPVTPVAAPEPELAATGSSTGLAPLAAAGAVALALGAGMVRTVRRRATR